jgi:NAD(P)H-hydrate epimerase
MPGHIRPMFKTADGLQTIPGVTASEMRKIDRFAAEVFQLSILQMMENAGRNLAQHAHEMAGARPFRAVIVIGPGGNGGGGLCCARHLHNHQAGVQFILAQPAAVMHPAAVSQLNTLKAAGLTPARAGSATQLMQEADIIIDALLGYSLSGAPRGEIAELIQLVNKSGKLVLALDLPSGLDATTGECPGVSVRANRTLTLALPKRGLIGYSGQLHLADIGIPPELYRELNIDLPALFHGRYSIELQPMPLQV